jgi:hypothetical protein
MAAIAKVLPHAPGTQADIESFQTVAIFCGVGLVGTSPIGISDMPRCLS